MPVTVGYATANGTATGGSDFNVPASDAQIIFAPGETIKTITIDVLGDTGIEDHESFLVMLSNASGATIDTGTATGTILNDDTALQITALAEGLEGDSGTTPFVFTVGLEKASALPVTVSYAAVDGTATGGSDFNVPAGDTQVTFAPGETTKMITVDVLGDVAIEDHETFSVVLANATNAVITSGTALATILNDDTLIRIGDESLLEGHSGSREMTFTVSLAVPSALPVSVDFESADGTALAGSDYTALTPGTLTFAPGETTKTIGVEVLGDTLAETGVETFSVVVSGAVNAGIDVATGIGTILDDDVTLTGSRKATFTDADGEIVTIKVSKGALKVEDFTIVPTGLGSQLALVDFSGEAEFTGTKLSIKSKRVAGVGDGAVDVGAIDATGIGLGNVSIKGDLGQINAGNGADGEPGVVSLKANSLGQRGLETKLPGGSWQSEIVGALKKFQLSAGMHDAELIVSGDLGSVKVKGDVLGSAIRSGGTIGAIQIGGDLAASAAHEATISALGLLAPVSSKKALAIASIAIGGSVERAQILAGYDHLGAAVNADASIGKVPLVRIGWPAA